jgi:hypothetical protein
MSEPQRAEPSRARLGSFPPLLPPTPTLSLCPAVPTCQLVLNLPPTISLPWTRPRPRVLRPRPRPHAPFEPLALLAHLSSLICALCPTLSPSLLLCPRVQRAPPPPAVDRCLFRGHRRARAPSSATVSSALLQLLGTPFGVPFPSLMRLVHAHRSSPCVVGAPPPSPCRALAPPPLLRDASASARGEQPARALNLAIAALFSARLFARVASRRR